MSGSATSSAASPRPIPGEAAPGDPRDPVEALVRFYRAFNERDLRRMEQSWEHSEEISAISPLAGVARGWGRVWEGYQRILQSSDRLETEFYEYTLHSAGDLCYAVGRERGQLISSRGVQPLTGQATNILRRGKDGAWRMLHHHVSLAWPAPPVPPAVDQPGPTGGRAETMPPFRVRVGRP